MGTISVRIGFRESEFDDKNGFWFGLLVFNLSCFFVVVVVVDMGEGIVCTDSG